MSLHLTVVEVGTATAVVGLSGFLAKIHYARRDAWWKRVQWAVDKAGDPVDDQARRLGLVALAAMADTGTRSDRDRSSGSFRLSCAPAAQLAFEQAP